ncbi:MAG: SH3 domain-containing protein [Candidatus Mucispirillum faecigallinarum]|nr:SH3 domain-containing protein [Candidatus Mucispirillum faecigallinarum]
MRKKILLVFVIVLLSFMGLSCSNTTVGKSKFSPYYFYTDTNKYLFEISRYELSKLITFDRLAYKGSYYGDRRMTKEDFENIKDNRNVSGIPSIVVPQVGFTLRSLNMKLYPTNITIHRGNEKFDANQYTRISAFAPVFILHISKDREFYYVMTEFMRGWIPAADVKIYSQVAFSGIQQMPFIRVVQDNVTIGNVKYGIGDKVPMLSEDNNSVVVLTPEGSYAAVEKNNTFVSGNAVYNENLMKAMAESQLNNPYDWGGKEGYRDCSAYVRDLWRVFGADIPRSSGLQKLVGKKLLDKPKSEEEFYAVLRNAKPYRTLLFFKGHVIMYGGMEDGDYVIYHAVNTLLNDDGKKVVISKVAKNKLKEEKFVNIWKRVIRVSEISPLISPELPKEPELIEITNIMDKISEIGSYSEKEMAGHDYTTQKQN